ncbi:MAG: hypothetical protein IKR53_00420, partial [Clostridia bacterium]|nr:hypothetical protein [Clostridia bacterium]
MKLILFDDSEFDFITLVVKSGEQLTLFPESAGKPPFILRNHPVEFLEPFVQPFIIGYFASQPAIRDIQLGKINQEMSHL